MSDSPADGGAVPDQGTTPAPADGSYPAPPDASYPAPPDASYPAPPDASYPAPPDGSYPAPDDGGSGVPVRLPQPAPPPPPRPAPRRAAAVAAGVGVVLVLGTVGAAVARNAWSSGPSTSPGGGSTYQVPTGPAGRIDVTLAGGIDDHFVGTPGGACGPIGIGTTGTQLLQVDTTNAARTIQFTLQVVPYQRPGTFVFGQTRINGTVYYRPTSGPAQLLSARSGQVQVSSSGGKLGGSFDLQFSGPAAPQPTHVTGTFSCG